MSYATKDELSKALGATPLLELCDDGALGDWTTQDADGVTNTDRLGDAITQAGRDIDGYCRARFKVPFTTTPPMVARIATSLAIWYLYRRRRSSFGIPEDVQLEYEGALRALERINEGKLDPGVEPEPTVSSKSLCTYDGPEQLFTSTKLQDF